jgi:hypothetical protein
MKHFEDAIDSSYVKVTDLVTLVDCFHFSFYHFMLCEMAIPKIIDLKNYNHIKTRLTFTDDQDGFEQKVLHYYIQKMKINYKSKIIV